jgi:adenylylsulfate kinase-like enzyme/chloramphenicol 3-O-phosphotransferase
MMPLLWLYGPSGAGKSSVGWEVYAQLSRSGIRTAFVDADQIGLMSPAPAGGTHRLRARNLAALAANFRQAGAQCLVLSGFVHTSEEVRLYDQVGAVVTLCRLRVGPGELERRFLGRGWRPELVREAVAEAEALERGDFADVCVDTDGLTVPETALLVRERTGGWPHLSPTGTPVMDTPAMTVSAGTRIPVLWLCGATAVGKSTVGYEVFTQLNRAGVRAAYVDMKQIGALRPAPSRHLLKARNLAAVWAGYSAAGAHCLIVSGEADTTGAIRDYAALLPGATVTTFRLHARPGTLAGRVALRGQGGGPAIPGDELRGLGPAALRRVSRQAARAAEALDLAGVGDLRIDTDDRPPHEVAARIRALWSTLEEFPQ